MVALSGALWAPLQPVYGQTVTSAEADSLLHRDYAVLKSADSWFTADNAAGLVRLGNERLSEASLSFNYRRGDFVNYYQAPREQTFGANVESFYRLTDRIALYGKMEYANRSSRDVAGSAWIEPSRMPFDIVEATTENIGKKHIDQYHLAGAIGYQVLRRLAIGVKIDHQSANYAKYKDLRHKNNRMLLTVTPGIYLPLTDWLTLGANFFYQRNTESVRFNTYGTSDKVYRSIIDYGGFWGKMETFGERGYTDESREMPFFSEHIGWGGQAEVRLTEGLSWYNDVLLARRHGYYGKKSPYTVSFNQHQSREYTYQTRLSWTQKNNRHYLDAALNIENLKNFSNSYRSVTDNQTSASYYEYFTPVKLANKVWTSASVGYTALLDVRQWSSKWLLHAGIDLFQRKQTAYLYPYYRHQHLKSTAFNLRAERNLSVGKGVLTLGAGGEYQKGSGDAFTDGTFIEPSELQSAPPTMDIYLHREHLWLTAPQYSVGGKVRYAFLFPQTRLKTFASLEASRAHLNGQSEWFDGNNRTSLTLTVGCTF